LGRGATVAQRTLDPFILVRIRAPQPEYWIGLSQCQTKIQIYIQKSIASLSLLQVERGARLF
jgi:hypothetical protein